MNNMKDISGNRLQWIELSASALKQNIVSLAELSGKSCSIAACVKANAYGHGLQQITGLLREIPAVDYLSVHSIEEAAQCRESGWDRKILLLGPFPPERVSDLAELKVEPTVFTLSSLRAIGALSKKNNERIRTHLKLETGTNRQGVSESELPRFAELYQKFPGLGGPYGASMHFANIEDTTDHRYALGQLKRFQALVKRMRTIGIKPKIRHAASSAAMILLSKTHFDLVRPGLSVYGHWPSTETYVSHRMAGGSGDIFRPVLAWKTRVTQLKQLEADSFVGYGLSYRTTASTKLAVLPIGYADGYSRSLSNQGYVLIKGRRAPVRGRVCMNLVMVDVGHIKGVRVGDIATLIGRDVEEEIKAEQLAEWAVSINYEILARLSPAIARTVVE